MKFRYKVLTINLILLSLSISAVGYFMIQKNYVLAKETQLANAIVQNNLLQSSVEYEVLQFVNDSTGNLERELPQTGEHVARSLRAVDTVFYIRYGDDYLYCSDGILPDVTEKLFENLRAEEKNYVIAGEAEKHYIYVTSCSRVQNQYLYIISKSEVSEIYELRKEQTKHFRLVLLGILFVDSILMYLISMYLTKPLENLSRVSEQMAEGDYQARVQICTGDEIGLLAEKFNFMAGAVAEHVEELNDMIRRRDQFVADFTHEIKTPMTTIIGYADTMRSMELPREEEIMALNYIFSEGKRLESMSGKLFELIYLKQHDIDKKAIHVTELVSQVVKIVEPAMAKKHIQITFDIDPAVTEGNKELLVTAFVNLMDNARKASLEGQSIEFVGRLAEEPGDYRYELTVIDHGIGMTEEEAKRICDEFYMADKSRSRKEGGAGIGMSLVALILEHHGADLWIESEPGNGTRMHVRFPSAYREDAGR